MAAAVAMYGRELDNPNEPERTGLKPPTAQSWWIVDGRAYMTFGRQNLPPIPRRQVDNMSRQFTARDMCELGWIRPGYQYLAFTPRIIPDYENTLLAPLAIGLPSKENVTLTEVAPSNAPPKPFGKPPPVSVEQAGSSTSDVQPSPTLPLQKTKLNAITTLFKLQWSRTQAWMDFEALLLHAVRLLLVRNRDKSIRLPPRPVSNSLQYSFDSQDAAIRNIHRVRQKFFPWLGLLSYLVACLSDIGYYEMRTGKIEKWPIWKGTLLIAGIPPSTIDLFDTSILASHDPKYPRVGTIVDLQADPQSFYLEMMEKNMVPVIYTVSLDSLNQLPLPHLQTSFLHEFRRTIKSMGSPQEMEMWLRTLIPSDVVQHVDMDQDHLPFDDTDAETFPHLDPNSRQRAFETRESFFAREALEDAKSLACESEKSKTERLAREAEMKTYNEPGQSSKAAVVYTWEWEGRYEIRQRISRSSVPDIWDEFLTENMRWNALRNEWDLWYNQPSSLRPDLDDEEELNGQGDNDEANPLPSLEDTIKHYINSSLKHLASNAVNYTKAESTMERSTEFGLCRAMHEYFGLHTDADVPVMSSKVLKKWEDIVGKPNRLAILLLDSSALETPSGPSTSQLQQILCMTAFYAARSETPPPLLSDLCNVHINNIGNTRISVTRTSLLARLINAEDSPPRTLYSIQLLDELHEPMPDSYGRRIYVWSATVALAIKRLSSARSRSIGHVAEALINNGSGFIIAVPLNSLVLPPPRPRVPPLGRRFRNYKPDASDFALYRDRCADLLSVGRLRRALRCGGILGRIARDFLSPYDGIDGPLDDALHEPMIIYSSRRHQNNELVEAGLSIEEVLILLGAFESRDDGGLHKPVYYSFWPPPWIWEVSGFNLGYWAPDCEAWYTTKLQEYLAGTGDFLLNVNQWAQKLKRFADTVAIAKTLEKQCSEIIDGKVLC